MDMDNYFREENERINTLEHIKAQVEEYKKYHPEMYIRDMERDAILVPSRQRELARMDEQAFHDYITDRTTFYHLDIYPENASDVMRAFNEEIFAALNALNPVYMEDLDRIRDELGPGAELIELDDWGDFYTLEPREKGDAMKTGRPEYKVKSAEHIPGPNFLATTTGGYHGFVKFYEEEAWRIAPEGANAWLQGNAWMAEVSCGKTRSPIIAGDYREVPLEDAIYHIIPVQFYRVEVDKGRKYEIETETEELAWDEDGKCTSVSMRSFIVPR